MDCSVPTASLHLGLFSFNKLKNIEETTGILVFAEGSYEFCQPS